MTNEEFYDNEIAPVLAELAKKCGEREMGFLSAVGLGPESIATTSLLFSDSGIAMTLASLAIHAKGNVDELFFALKRYADKHGHNSIVLEMLGKG